MPDPNRLTVREAVFVFDAAGDRVASSPEADRAIHGVRVRRRQDVERAFRQPDGAPLSLEGSATRPAIPAGPWSGGRTFITSRALAPANGVSEALAGGSIVAIKSYADDDDPATVQRVLGAVLAHELRTPMTTVFGGAQLVSDPSVSATTRSEAAVSVAREARHLHRVVEDLIALVRLGPNDPPDLEPLLLQRLLPPVIQAHRSISPEQPIEAAFPRSLPPVLASEREVTQLFDNVLAHAVLYSPRESPIRVRARRSGERVELRVVDEGPPRDRVAATTAFDLYTRSARTTADPSGANLALVMARRLAERMNGRIWAIPRTHGGEIRVELAIADGAPAL